jgi:divalent metal cation (Fe/Co/Zn/Cd) transporter
MLVTSAAIVSVLLGPYVKFPIDGTLGVAISCFILFTGFKIAKGTIALLLGRSPSSEIVEEILSMIPIDKNILGTHDLAVHDYGPGKVLASIHVEVPDTVNIVEIHSTIDAIEERIEEKLRIHTVIHVDPICTDDKVVSEVSGLLSTALSEIEPQTGFTHLRVIKGNNRTSIRFDLTVPPQFRQENVRSLTKNLQNKLRVQNVEFICTVDDIIVKKG